MPLFDRYLVVDWSAKNQPSQGKDSIWIAFVQRVDGAAELVWVKNPPTRHEALQLVTQTIAETQAAGLRIFAGFDFAFGYPKGAAEALTGAADWQAVWNLLNDRIVDGPDNRSNRFEVAAALNRDHLENSLFWGHPGVQAYDGLSVSRPVDAHASISHRRLVETRVPTAKSIWQLCYNGSVGSQSLLGIPVLQRLRNAAELAEPVKIWPFETGFAEDLGGSVVAEIYPSMVPVSAGEGEVKDEVQVRTMARLFAELDGRDELLPLLAEPQDLSVAERETVLREEGWIVGAGHKLPKLHSPTITRPSLEYLRDPQAIYDKSFATIRAEANLSRFSKGMEDLAIRMIHASGMVDIADDIVFSDGAFEIGAQALSDGARIFVDAEMVRHGIIRRLLPKDNDVICLLNDPRVRPLAEDMGSTRSAAQVDLWLEQLAGSVVAIGNAPTALFRLLELLEQGMPRPALILGFPVGFVGAAESKEALASGFSRVPFIAMRGRRGGSAMASSAVNALAGGLGTNV